MAKLLGHDIVTTAELEELEKKIEARLQAGEKYAAYFKLSIAVWVMGILFAVGMFAYLLYK